MLLASYAKPAQMRFLLPDSIEGAGAHDCRLQAAYVRIVVIAENNWSQLVKLMPGDFRLMKGFPGEEHRSSGVADRAGRLILINIVPEQKTSEQEHK